MNSLRLSVDVIFHIDQMSGRGASNITGDSAGPKISGEMRGETGETGATPTDEEKCN